MAPIDAVQGILKKWMTSYAPPACCNWGDFTDTKLDKLGAAAVGEFDAAKRDTLLTQMNEQAVADASELYIVHDLNPRALSPKLSGFVQAQSWFQDLTPTTGWIGRCRCSTSSGSATCWSAISASRSPAIRRWRARCCSPSPTRW